MRILTVLRSGGEYTAKHAQVLAAQVQRHGFPYKLEVLTDVEIPGIKTIPLRHNWPGWWAKLALFDPDIKADILYFDLDTVIVDGLEAIVAVNRLTVLRDFYRDGVHKGRAEGLGSGLMFLPEADRAEVWAEWITDPQKHMRTAGHKGDQAFLESLWLSRAARWQDLVPGQIVSYKAHCNPQWRQGATAVVPPEARVICFHGKPRPWAAPEFQHLYRAA